MLDLLDKIEVFLLTNGRSTFSHCLNSVKKQNDVKVKITVIENLPMIEACNRMLDLCKSDHYIMLGDDMILHPLAVRYMSECLRRPCANEVLFLSWQLWEVYSSMPVFGVKLIDFKQAKQIGYRTDARGKVDKTFVEDARKAGMKVFLKNDSIVGVHACSSADEHIRYAKLRGEDKDKSYWKKKKCRIDRISKCSFSLDDQFKMRGDFVMLKNEKMRTDFSHWRKGKNR